MNISEFGLIAYTAMLITFLCLGISLTTVLAVRQNRVLQRRVHDLLKHHDRLETLVLSLDGGDLASSQSHLEASLVELRADMEWASQALVAHLAHVQK